MRYFPVLLSKAGEFKALGELASNVKVDISPIIEILSDNIASAETNLLRDWSFSGNQILLDFSSFGAITPVNVGNVQSLFDNLIAGGVNAIPVIQQNSSVDYLNLVTGLIARYNCNVCIRASNNGGGLNNYNTMTAGLIAQVGITNTSTILLIDLGYAEVHNYNVLSALAIALISAIPNNNQWLDIVVTSGSFPVDVSHLLPANTLHRLTRYEWNIWNAINAIPNIRGIVKYGDYGNKNPIYGGEAPYAGSCSLKYTSINEFLVYRGTLARDHAQGNGQYIIFADRLIRTTEYSGAAFSWGDFRIDQMSRQTPGDPRSTPGNARTWVEITQNHHITLLHSLL